MGFIKDEVLGTVSVENAEKDEVLAKYKVDQVDGNDVVATLKEGGQRAMKFLERSREKDLKKMEF